MQNTPEKEPNFYLERFICCAEVACIQTVSASKRKGKLAVSTDSSVEAREQFDKTGKYCRTSSVCAS